MAQDAVDAAAAEAKRIKLEKMCKVTESMKHDDNISSLDTSVIYRKSGAESYTFKGLDYRGKQNRSYPREEECLQWTDPRLQDKEW